MRAWIVCRSRRFGLILSYKVFILNAVNDCEEEKEILQRAILPHSKRRDPCFCILECLGRFEGAHLPTCADLSFRWIQRSVILRCPTIWDDLLFRMKTRFLDSLTAALTKILVRFTSSWKYLPLMFVFFTPRISICQIWFLVIENKAFDSWLNSTNRL